MIVILSWTRGMSENKLVFIMSENRCKCTNVNTKHVNAPWVELRHPIADEPILHPGYSSV